MGDAEQRECSADVHGNFALLAGVSYDGKGDYHNAQDKINYRCCIQDETTVTLGSSVRILNELTCSHYRL
jgi:hypothetical protein